MALTVGDLRVGVCGALIMCRVIDDIQMRDTNSREIRLVRNNSCFSVSSRAKLSITGASRVHDQ